MGVTIAGMVLYSLGVAALGAGAAALDAGSDAAPHPGSAGRFGGVNGALAVAVTCFGVCALVVAYGTYLIVS
ncbi:MAG TPA: hypothetical protein VGH99_22450 [Pseudonocardia sp.]|jgi:hypothetical protein